MCGRREGAAPSSLGHLQSFHLTISRTQTQPFHIERDLHTWLEVRQLCRVHIQPDPLEFSGSQPLLPVQAAHAELSAQVEQACS